MYISLGDFQYIELKILEFGYEIVYTDCRKVYKESISNSEIRNRGNETECPFDLEGEEIRNFLNILATQIAQTQVNIDLVNESNINAEIDLSFTGIEYKWTFHLTLYPQQLPSLVKQLSSENEETTQKLKEKNRLISDQKILIQMMSEAIQRKTEFRVPSALEYLAKNDL